MSYPGPGDDRGPFAAAKNLVLLALRNRSARQANLGKYCWVITEGLVHVRDNLDDLAEQCAFAVVDHFGDEVGADSLAVGVELDLAVGRIDLDLGESFLELRLVVAEVTIDLTQRKDKRHRRAVVVGGEQRRAGEALV